jgi:hypothetical protein
MPDIKVNNHDNGNNFNPTPYPLTGKVAQDSTLSFRANGNRAIRFYAYDEQLQDAFTTGSPYTAPAKTSKPAQYTLKNGVSGAVTLSLTKQSIARPDTGANGTINVGGGGDPEPK